MQIRLWIVWVLLFVSLLSSHPEAAKTAVHPPKGTELPNAGAAAHRVAGEGTLWVFRGRFSQEETQQKLLLPRGHLPVPQGKKSMTVLTESIRHSITSPLFSKACDESVTLSPLFNGGF